MQTFTEKEAEDFLEKNGFSVAKRAYTENKNDLKKISEKINFPWVMKISSKKIVHKFREGGVLLNISNISDAEKAFQKFKEKPNFEGVIIQEMLEGKEIILGIKHTPEFGQVIMFGKGGTNVESDKQVAFRVLPLNEKEILELINEVKFSELIENKKLLIENIKKISDLSQKYPDLAELDINPLMINSREAKVVDARLIFD
jgi:succinyl-CoA synthetase beta subunit